MRDRLTLWFPAGLLVLLAMLSFWLDSTVQPPQPKNDGSSRHDPDYTVENFTATRMGMDGLPHHTLTAAKMVLPYILGKPGPPPGSRRRIRRCQ